MSRMSKAERDLWVAIDKVLVKLQRVEDKLDAHIRRVYPKTKSHRDGPSFEGDPYRIRAELRKAVREERQQRAVKVHEKWKADKKKDEEDKI